MRGEIGLAAEQAEEGEGQDGGEGVAEAAAAAGVGQALQARPGETEADAGRWDSFRVGNSPTRLKSRRYRPKWTLQSSWSAAAAPHRSSGIRGSNPLPIAARIGIKERQAAQPVACPSSSMPTPANCTCRRAGGKEPTLTNSLSRLPNMGTQVHGMPPLQVVRGKDGHLRINDGVMRATRAAQARAGTLVPAEVIQELPQVDVTRTPKVKDSLP